MIIIREGLLRGIRIGRGGLQTERSVVVSRMTIWSLYHGSDTVNNI